MQGRGSVAVLARLAAGVLAQYPLKLHRTDALLVLKARPAILAQEHLLVTDVHCKAETNKRGRKSEGTASVRRKTEKEREQREEQSDRMTGGKRIVVVVGGGNRHKGKRQMYR